MKLSEAKTDAPLNLMFHDGTINIENDRNDVYEVDAISTINIANAMSDDEWQRIKTHPTFLSRFRLVFPDIDLPDHPLKLHGNGVKHVVGLILLTDLAIAAGKKPFWRNPEAHLHPRAQLGLGDLLIQYIK